MLAPGGRLSCLHVDVTGDPSVVTLEAGVWLPDADRLACELRSWLNEELRGAEAVVLRGHPLVAVCAWAGGACPDPLVAAEWAGWQGGAV